MRTFSAIDNGICISIESMDENTITEIAKDLCVFFHREPVMITERNIRAYVINETL